MEINESLIFTLKGKSYEMTFPRVGEYRTIEAMKQTLSLNMYGSLLRTQMLSSEEALDMIDMEAYFTILCPKLEKDMICSFSELGLVDYLELKKIFKEQFRPWWGSIEALLHPVVPKKEADVSEDN
jgi:hypothetical protein